MSSPPPPPHLGSGTNLRVIVCDDEWEAATELAEYLSDQGYDVVAVDNGSLALSLLNAAIGPVCLVSDIRMPGLSGLDLLHAAVQRSREWPTSVVLVTGHVDANESLARYPEAVATLMKPIDLAELDLVLLGILSHQ